MNENNNQNRIEKIKCPKCSYEMSVGNKRCPKCGTNIYNLAKKCNNCGSIENSFSRFCSKCGALLEDNYIEKTPAILVDKYCNNCKLRYRVEEGIKCIKCGGELIDAEPIINAKEGNSIIANEFDKALFSPNENNYINKVIINEIKKDTSYKMKTLPSIERRKLIMTIIYGVLFSLIIMLYVAYHIGLTSIILLLIVLTFIYIIITRKYNLKSVILKEVKLRPDEKITNISASILSSATITKAQYILLRTVLLYIFIVFPIIVFRKPLYIYEKQDSGYVLRYYTIGVLEQEENVIIPEKYNNLNVVGIRGDVFKNISSIKKVTLPNTIKEIRGGAFQNCYNLERINLPSELEQIHGDTFFNCTSLTSISIPDSVTRIGGHAFYGCSNLSTVSLTKNSKLNEIGSSAFRRCYNLHSITLPSGVNINERAFKESPTYINYFNDESHESYINY